MKYGEISIDPEVMSGAPVFAGTRVHVQTLFDYIEGGDDFGIDHEVWTVRDKGWLSKKNGELLKLMINDRFELFVTADQHLQYQQRVEKLPLTIAV
jgi:hypothetical protein